jgi:hypothetical protein
MTFLNLGALFGLAAISIPIIIHLLNKFQVKEVTWAAMRFLKESIEKNSRRLQIEDILLLILRCLLVALLVLVLSRPTWQSSTKSSGSHQVSAVLIIDNSYSMGLTNGIQTSLQRAQSAAEQILGSFPTGSSSALFFAADNVQPVVAQPTYDFNLLRNQIRQAKLTDRATDLTNALQLAVATLQKNQNGQSKEIYLITDGQANGFPAIDQLEKQLTDIQKEVAVHIVLVGDTAESNLGVTDLRIEGGLTPINQPIRCSISVLNGSQSEARDVRVSLNVDNQPAVDQRTLAIRAVREVKVLLVEGTTALTPSQADDFFVRNALVPVAPSDVSQYYIKTNSIAATALASTSLDDYDAVFFLDVDQLDASLVPTITNYVRQGGGLVIFPGPSCSTDFYNHTLGQDGFLPAKMGPYRGDTDPRNKDKFFTLQSKDYDHPIVSLWNDPSAGVLTSAHFYAYYPLTPTPWTAPAAGQPNPPGGRPRVILHFAQNDDPLAIEHTWGSGRVVMFASTATIAWNDLPIHLAFVPLMQRTLGSLVERQDEGLNVRVGQKFSYVVGNDLLNKNVSVTVPGQTEPPRVESQVTLVNGVPVVTYRDKQAD